MDWHQFPLFLILSTNRINQCTTFFFPIISLCMLIFKIVYPIDNALHLFSINWNVLSIISDMIPPIFLPGWDLSSLFCACSYPLCIWHKHKKIKTSLVSGAASSCLFICFIITFHHSFDFCFQFFVIFCFINIL